MEWRGILILAVCAWAGPAGQLGAQDPELSAEGPITFETDREILVARGNAQFVHEQAIVEAEEIRFDRRAGRVSARGNVRVTRVGVRLVTEELTYDIASRRFSSGPFRAGFPPVFVEGAAFEGTLEATEFRDASLHYGAPDPWAPSLAAATAEIGTGERLSASGVRLGLPLGAALPLPRIEQRLDSAPPLMISGDIGFRSNLGGFVRSEVLLPISEHLAMGGNLDVYTARGVLVGPALRYRVEEEGYFADANISAGWIYDTGDRGVDLLGESIDSHRGFASAGFRVESNDLEVAGRTQYLSDSEVMRDFRPDHYEAEPVPDSYLEIVKLWDDRFLTLFLRRTPNDFHGLTERLPELSMRQPARPLGETPVLYSWDASVARYRLTGVSGMATHAPAPLLFSEDDTSLIGSLFTDSGGTPRYEKTGINDRADLNYTLQYPMHLSTWSQLVPRAGLRYTYWRPDNAISASRLAGEVGFDLTAHAFADWNLRNRTWRIDGLRHIVRPVLQVRWQPATMDGELSAEHRLERRLYSPLLPVMDLNDRRDVDALDERGIIRLGLENRLLTRDTASGSRTLLEVDLYQDIVPTVPDGADEWHGTYMQLRTQPARWLELSMAQRFRTEGFSLEEARLRATIRSAERWEVTFAADFLDAVYDQYRLEGFYRIHPRFALFTGLRYDAQREELTRQIYGIRQRLGRNLEVDYALAFREGAEREGDFSIRLGIRLVDF